MKSGTSMAAPQVSGVAALMAAVRSDLSAADLRAQLIQNASRASLPVGSGYVDALGAVSAVSGATSYDVGQRPVLRVLRATGAKRGRTVTYACRPASAARPGPSPATASRPAPRLAVVRPRGTPFGVRAKRRGRMAKRVTVVALNRAGKKLATASARVRKVAKGKRRVGGGEGLRDVGAATQRRRRRRGRARRRRARRPAAEISLSGSNVALPLVADLAFYYRRAVRHPPRFTLTGGGSPAG